MWCAMHMHCLDAWAAAWAAAAGRRCMCTLQRQRLASHLQITIHVCLGAACCAAALWATRCSLQLQLLCCLRHKLGYQLSAGTKPR